MAEATPCSRSETPVAAAMNIAVNTTPSAMLSATSPGTSAEYEESADIVRPSPAAPSAPSESAPTMVRPSPNRVTSRPPRVEPPTTNTVGMRKATPVCSAP
jgi:hypothetical protein